MSNLALGLCDLGRYEEAQAIVSENRSAYRRFEDRWTRTRLLWLEGRIAHGLKQPVEAERLFLEARNAYIGAGLVPVFRAKNVHREAAAALLLFHKAALDESVTAALIGRARRFLEEARQDPKLRFRPEEPNGANGG